MPNSITLAKQYIDVLDAIYKNASLTGVLDGDNTMVRAGANAGEIIVPKLDMSGLGAYSRETGYVRGAVSLTWETVAADYERGRKFWVDAMDDEESRNVAFGRLAGEFIRTKVVPELDAYRMAKYAGTTGIGYATGTLSTGADVVTALRTAVNTMDEGEVPEENRILFITPTLYGMLQDLDTTKSKEVLERFSSVVRIPQTRFYTAIDLYDGTTSGEEAGGYIKDGTSGKDINFLAIHKDAVVQFNKHAAPKILPPDVNPDGDAYVYGYRVTSLARVYDNKKAGIYCHHKA